MTSKNPLQKSPGGRYVKLYLYSGKETFVSNLNIGSLETKLLGAGFVKSHRCVLVNMAYIKEIGRDIELDNGVHVKLSRRETSHLKEKYFQFVRKMMR